MKRELPHDIWFFYAAAGVFLCSVGATLGQRGFTVRQRGLPITVTRKSPIPPALSAREERAGKLAIQANEAMEAGDYAAAETDAKQALDIDRATPFADEIYAAALNAQGKTQKALQAYRVMSDRGGVFPDNELPYALLLLKTGHWAQAVEAYYRQLPYLGEGELLRSHCDFSPEVPRPKELATTLHIALGLTVEWRGYHGTYQAKYQQALAQFQKALTLEPDSALTTFYYAYGLRRTGRWREAEAAFEKTAAMDHGDIRQAAEDCLAHRK